MPSTIRPRRVAVDVGEIAVLDAPPEVALEDDVLEHAVQAAIVAPLRGRGETDMEPRLQIGVDLAVGRGQGVMRLVGDDHVELTGLEGPLEPVAARERLDGGGDDLFALTPLPRLLDAHRTVVVLDRLVNELVAMREQ